MSLTYNEMKNQYDALQKTFDYMLSKKNELIEFYKMKSPKSFTYLGCGSGFCLCRSGEFTAKVRLGIPATAIPAGDVMLHYDSYKRIFEDSLIIAPSRSGSTSEVVKAIENIKRNTNVPVLAISCMKNSLLSKTADLCLEIPWAFDESVCQTRSVTNLYTVNLLVIAFLTGDTKLVKDIETVIKLGKEYMENYEKKIKKAAEGNWTNVVILADGEMQGIACEGAMAFTEIAEIHTSYFHILDARHGPMVLINKDTLVIAAINSNGFEYQEALIFDILARGAKVITYSDKLEDAINGVSLHVSSHVELDPAVHGIPFIFISQMISYKKAVEKGLNPDTPSGLAAWIKL